MKKGKAFADKSHVVLRSKIRVSTVAENGGFRISNNLFNSVSASQV
jgi:hypothetical protein